MNTSVATDQAHDVAPASMPFTRQLHAYCTEIKFETLVSLRTPAFAIPFLLIPALVYLLFGVVMMTPEALEGDLGPGLANYLFSGISVMAVMMAGIFWLSGLFIPLPGFLEAWTVVWPGIHINQLALGLAGVEEFSFFPPLMSAGILMGVTLLFGGIAAHKLARKG